MCDCKKNITDRLLDAFKERAPEASEHSIELTGYGFIFGKKIVQKGYMEIKSTARYPLKKGGNKDKTKKQNLMFTYCPFCAEKYDDENQSVETGDDNQSK